MLVEDVKSFISASSYFDELFINAILFGMSYRQYWHGNAEIYWAYQVAYEKQLEQNYEFENYKAWLNGLYNFDAMNKSVSNGNRSKESDPVQYFMDRPIDFKKLAQEDINEKKQIALENKMKAMITNRKALITQKKVG